MSLTLDESPEQRLHLLSDFVRVALVGEPFLDILDSMPNAFRAVGAARQWHVWNAKGVLSTSNGGFDAVLHEGGPSEPWSRVPDHVVLFYQ